MENYKALVRDIRENGNTHHTDRTGTGTTNVTGRLMRWRLRDGFPQLGLKFTPFKAVLSEQLWILSGQTSLKFLLDHNNHIWDDWVIPGTEVWGDQYSIEERWGIFLAKVQRGVYTEARLAAGDIKVLNGDLGRAYDDAERDAICDSFKIHTHRLLDGQLGKIYGHQMRKWSDTRVVLTKDFQAGKYAKDYKCTDYIQPRDGDSHDDRRIVIHRDIDQIGRMVETLKNNPDSRRHLTVAWNPGELEEMALTPCHMDFQMTTELLTLDERMEVYRRYLNKHHLDFIRLESEDPVVLNAFLDKQEVASRRLNCVLHMRSVDVGLGLPFNIASYALLTHMMAQVVNMEVGDLVWVGGDVHIYSNHEKLDLILDRETPPLPTLRMNPNIKRLEDFTMGDFELVDYTHGGKIELPVAV
jgi:thymidylate synthase